MEPERGTHDVAMRTACRPTAGTSLARRCFDDFYTAVCENFVPLTVHTEDRATFGGRLTLAQVGPLYVADIAADAHVVRRTSQLVRRPADDFYKLSLQVEGHGILSQDGRDAVLRPGDLALYDTTRPYGLRFDEPFRMVVLMFRRSLLRVPESSVRRTTGQRIGGDRGLGMLMGPFLTGLAGQAGIPAGAVSINLADAVLDMTAAAIDDEFVSGGPPASGPRQAVLLGRIKSYIEERLGDPELDSTSIAAAHHISPRYLRKLFEAEGDSVGRWIRGRRLERCRHDLARPELADRPVSVVAARWCLADPAYFSRLFKSVYAQSPREYRQAALPTVGRW